MSKKWRCDIDTNIPLDLRNQKIPEKDNEKDYENKRPDGSLRCKKYGYIFILYLSGIEDINLDN